MKIFNKTQFHPVILMLLAVCSVVSMQSCKEDIDDSALYTFTGETMIDHLENHPDTFSCYLTLLKRVHPSNKSVSTMYELLSARGNYTCFAPNNEAITHYVDSLYQIGEETTNDLTQISDSLAQAIVFNTIIENGNNSAFESTSFQDPMPTNNMNDRPIRVTYSADENGNTQIFINIHAKVIEKDVEVENGYIHVIDNVISPSNATVADLISSTDNTQIFGDLLKTTGWDMKMTNYRDYSYDEKDEAGTTYFGSSGSWEGKYPEHRYLKYTVFVETDSVLEANGITDVESLKQYLKEHAYYDSNTSWGDDYENEDNAVNQFVAYHCVAIGLSWSNMVMWSNEYGYSNANLNDGSTFRVNVWEYWETMGKHRRTLKVTGLRNNRRQINRYSVYNKTTYREIASQCEDGIEVLQTNGQNDNESLNGYYFPINDMLVWTEKVPNKVLNERMRYDICSLLPELISAGCRLNRNASWYFTPDYFENIPQMSDQTEFEYLSNTAGAGGSGSWLNYQSDEFNIRGVYDFVMKLPPVPYTGTYEIRYGVNANGNRGMAQIYVGKNPNNLPAIGIPLDLRIGGGNALVGWQSDATLGSEDAINELDKTMRLNGYMKGPKYFCPGAGIPGRDCTNCLRRIIFTGQLEAGETYYIRFKSVLSSTQTEFFYDYLELVPKSIYNGDIAEDKW